MVGTVTATPNLLVPTSASVTILLLGRDSITKAAIIKRTSSQACSQFQRFNPLSISKAGSMAAGREGTVLEQQLIPRDRDLGALRSLRNLKAHSQQDTSTPSSLSQIVPLPDGYASNTSLQGPLLFRPPHLLLS